MILLVFAVDKCRNNALNRRMAAQKRTDGSRLPEWDGLRVALAISRGGTFSAAARALGVDHTTIARRLSALEDDLGHRLFERQSTGFVLTAAGEEAVAAAERMEAEGDGLLRRLDGASALLTGRVRLTATPQIAAKLIAPALAGLMREHPHLQVELIGDDRALDLSRREADLAVRLSQPDQNGLVARKIGEFAVGLYAGATDARPFAAQAFLAYESNEGGRLQRQFFELAPQERIMMRSNSMQVLTEAARAGLGAALLPCFVGDEDASLRRVETPRPLENLPLWPVFHEDLRRSPRVRAVASFLVDLTLATRARLAG